MYASACARIIPHRFACIRILPYAPAQGGAASCPSAGRGNILLAASRGCPRLFSGKIPAAVAGILCFRCLRRLLIPAFCRPSAPGRGGALLPCLSVTGSVPVQLEPQGVKKELLVALQQGLGVLAAGIGHHGVHQAPLFRVGQAAGAFRPVQVNHDILHSHAVSPHGLNDL
ncbi:MAG: hypothetical protein CW338_01125 [Clostridiales bacterium]|nr:hypothetical protein [Clostridiales bacterium]